MNAEHKIPIGTLVEVVFDEWFGGGACMMCRARMFVVGHTRDCDGSPLYQLAKEPREKWERPTWEEWEAARIFEPAGMTGALLYWVKGGFSEDSLRPIPITPALIYGEGALSWEDWA